jgi:hypothetical protein
MITFSKLGRYGRLGNQLFQYAFLLVVGQIKELKIKIPDYRQHSWHGQQCLLGNFNITAEFLSSDDKIEKTLFEARNKNFSYTPGIIYHIRDGYDILGFFQNYQYYQDHVDLLRKELSLKEPLVTWAKKQMQQIKKQNKGYEIVALHLRRGDTALNMYEEKWPIYFYRAKEVLKDRKIKFLIFTGGQRYARNNEDYRWCRNYFKGSDKFLFPDYEHTTINDFALMQQCDHYILSPISSFSWWVGFLNADKNKITIAPKKYWFLEKDLGEGFYPPNFILR